MTSRPGRRWCVTRWPRLGVWSTTWSGWLEIHARTGMFDPFEHMGSKVSRPSDLDSDAHRAAGQQVHEHRAGAGRQTGEKALTRSGMSATSVLLAARQGGTPLPVGVWGYRG